MKSMKSKSFLSAMVGFALIITLAVVPLNGQMGATSGASNTLTTAPATNPMSVREATLLCGGVTQQGTPIAANSPPGTAGINNTAGTIDISGIPATIAGLPTTVVSANLYWSVLTNDGDPPGTGSSVMFNGNAITGTNLGTAATTPCFPQTHTTAYRADVTSLVTSPGNGTYTVSGFAGGPNGPSDYTEGATLQIVWSNPNGSLMQDNVYHAPTGGLLAVTHAEFFSQSMTTFPTNASGPVSATLLEVIGNGQADAPENLRFNGPCSPAGGDNFDNSLDGSTSEHAAATCFGGAIDSPQCFWDDDVLNVNSDFACPAGNAATSASLVSDPAVSSTSDCFDWDSLNLLTSTDNATACSVCGAYVDTVCPTNGTYSNHGDYVSCVAHAAETVLAGLPSGGSCPRADVQSCCVNPRAHSQVGK